MSLHPLAGKPVPPSLIVNIPRLISEYFATHPDPADQNQLVAFGTSGHRGVSYKGTFNEDHIVAIAQSLAEHRRAKDVRGPLFLGIDTHALSESAFVSALEVFAANGVEARIQRVWRGYTPTPQLVNQVDVGSELSGTIAKVEVDFNDRVAAGQVLARLDTEILQARIAEARASLQSARARSAEAAATVTETRLNLERSQELLVQQMCSRSDLDALQAGYQRAQANQSMQCAGGDGPGGARCATDQPAQGGDPLAHQRRGAGSLGGAGRVGGRLLPDPGALLHRRGPEAHGAARCRG